MKKLKPILCLALGAAMLFTTACGGNKDSSTGGTSADPTTSGASGRYVETDVTPEGADGNILARSNDGSLVLYNSDLTAQWKSTDNGVTWQEEAGPAEEGALIYARTVAFAEDGTLYAEVVPATNMDSYASEIVRFTADGMQKVELEGITGDDGYFNGFALLPGGRMMVSYTGGLYMGSSVTIGGEEEATGDGDTDGETANESPAATETSDGTDEPEAEADPDAGDPAEEEEGNFTMASGDDSYDIVAFFDAETGEKLTDLVMDGQANDIAVHGNTLYILDYSGTVFAYDATTGERLDDAGSFMMDSFTFYSAFDVDANGIYYADNNSVYALTDDGLSTLMEGNAYSFGNPTTGLQGIKALDDGCFLLQLYEGDGTRLYRYEWDPNAKLDPEKVLKVWALNDSNTVRAAINEYRKQYPEGNVEFEIALTEDGGLEADDAIRNLNTEILGGNGPDIIILDGTPVDSYVKQGVLADISGLVETSGLYKGVQDAYAGDTMYYLPMRFTIPLLVADEGYGAATLEELIQQVDAGAKQAADMEGGYTALPKEERNALTFDDFDELFDVLWSTSAPAVVPGNALDSTALGEFFAALEHISTAYNLANPDPESGGGGGVIGFSTGGSASVSTIQGSSMAYLMQRANMAAFMANDIMVFSYLTENEDSTFSTLPGLVDGAWLPGTLAGINAASGKQDLAGEFMQLMLGDTVQGTRLNDGFPVSVSGMEKQVFDIQEMYREAREEYGEEVGYFEIDTDSLFANMTTPNTVDTELKGKIQEVALAYCKGETDLEGAVTRVEQEIKNYLAERQ